MLLHKNKYNKGVKKKHLTPLSYYGNLPKVQKMLLFTHEQ